MSKLSRRGEKKVRKIRETGETLYDILENSMLGNPIDENTL